MFGAIPAVTGRRAADGNTVACISRGFLVGFLFADVGEVRYPFCHNKK